MPATTEYHTSSPSSASSSFSNFGRSLLSIGRDHHVHSMEPPQRRRHHHEATIQELELDAFQRTVADRFHELSAAGPDDLLSLQWLQRLLDTFLCCQEEFRVILFNNKGVVNRAPMDRLVADFFERSVKALDVCNAIRDGIELIKQWQKQLEIVLCALDNQRCLGEGQFRRAKKSLIDLAIGMLDERETNANPSLAHRNRSFGRSTTTSSGSVHRDRSLGHFRSLSWSVSRTWSAARQLQAIGNNLVAPKVNEVAASNGLANAVFTMNSTLLFVMWALVAAIPCQDRGLQTHFNIPRHFVWAGPLLSLHDRIFEESKRRERKNSCGLLREIHRIEKCARQLNELADFVQFPLTEEKERDVRERVKELKEVYEEVRDCLDPLERRVREVFHTIVRSRTEGLDTLG